MNATNPLLKIEDLRVRFKVPTDVPAVDGISFCLNKGETLAIVGESGSGKSVTALALTRLLPPPPACQVSGRILLDGRDLLALSGENIRRVRGKDIAYVFQEPSIALNPVFSAGFQIAEAIKLHRPEVKDVNVEAMRLLDLAGIRDPAGRLKSFPHELSGGMQQRVMIAMALACQPRILVADEPTAALDTTIQKQIIDLIRSLKNRLSMSIILITHNFGIVAGFADRTIVMLRGRIVEEGPSEQVLRRPRHPYTRALIACVPVLGQRKRRLTAIDRA